MYQFNSNLPAPYELNTQPQMDASAPPSLARGGRPKNRKMVIAHFNPHELNVMDHLQGHQERCPKTGLRSYSHLEELLKNPHIVANVHKHAQHYAEGGPTLDHLAEGGRRGDTEIALIGPHTHHLFDSIVGSKTHNPHTGHPEYFNLGKALGGAWHAIKGAAPGVWNAVRGYAPAAGTALGSAVGSAVPGVGTALGASLGGMAGNALSHLGGKGGGNPNVNAAAQNIAQGIGSAYNAYRGGQSPMQALGQGLSQAGSNWGNSGLGQAMQGAGNAFSQGQGWRGALSQGARQGFNAMGGMAGLGRSAQNIMNGGNLGSEARNFAQRALPYYGQQAPAQNPNYYGQQAAAPDEEQYPNWLQGMNEQEMNA